ncbi:MAG TPA: glycosyltransferase family 2 protein [Pirellulales bacterium]|nr:glycosyltransferase family 2 protein [Pirellulales bacterium]
MDASDFNLTTFVSPNVPSARQAIWDWATVEPPRRMLSIIMPVFNEDGNLSRAYEEITAAMAPLPCDYEVLVIDNASTDSSGLLAAELCARDSRWRYICFSRNFGLEASMAAGFRLATGDAAMVLFGDLQDPPELIGQFTAKWEEGFDVVYGVIRRRTGDPLWKSKLAGWFYRIVNYLADTDVPMHATDFRLLSRKAIDAVNQFDECNRYIRGYSHWIGLRQCPIVYDRRKRISGRSKASFFYLINYAINAITCFSTKPLQLFSIFGLATLAVTAVLAIYYLSRFLLGLSAPGMPTTYLLLLANLSVMLLGFGTLGEYVGRIYLETKRRPLYLIERAINLFPQAGIATRHAAAKVLDTKTLDTNALDTKAPASNGLAAASFEPSIPVSPIDAA